MTIERSAVAAGDSIWVGRSYVSYEETQATVDHGVVIAVDEIGSCVYRDDAGRIHDLPWYARASLHSNQQEAWAAVAGRIASRAEELAGIAAECRAKASVEVIA
jgi:hypothetical protein